MHKNIRDRDLLNFAYDYPCMLEIDDVCEGGNGEPCHANWGDYGKGGAMKSHDLFHVPGCRCCHHELDHGKRLEKEERRNIWERAFRRYIVALWLDGRIGRIG